MMETALRLNPPEGAQEVALRHALRLWADASTAPSTERREELRGYKQRVVASFFSFADKSPGEVSALNVEAWRDRLSQQKSEGLGLRANTVYARVCFLSSFFEWAMKEPALCGQIGSNPARLALPKAPKAYQTESVKAWTDEQLQAIVEAVRAKAVAGEVVGREVCDPLLREALLDYLSFSGRLSALKTDSPLWTRHDRAGRPGAALSSHAFVKKLKRYAREAGVGDIHLHQTRHSFARIVAEETGSIIDTQDALGHRNAATTRVYVQRIAIRRDKHSGKITGRLRK